MRRLASALLVAAWWMAIPADAVAGLPPLPWRPGEAVVPGWVLTEVEDSAHFTRFGLSGYGREVRLEVVPGAAVADADGAAAFRVQAAPGGDVPGDLIAAVQSRLGALWPKEAPPASPPAAADPAREPPPPPPPPPPSAPDPPGTDGLRLPVLVLDGLAVLLLVFVGASLGRRLPEARTWMAALAVALAAWTVWALALLDPMGLPVDLFTFLHEGRSATQVSRVYIGAIPWEHQRHLCTLLASGAWPEVRDVVRVNLWLSGVAVALFLGIGRVVTGRALPALLLAAGLATSRAFLHAAWSASPYPLVSVLFLAGVVAAAGLSPSPDGRRAVPFAALALLVVVAVLACLTRPETIVIGAPACAVAVLRVVGGEARTRRVAEALVRPLAWVLDRPVVFWATLLGLVATSLLVDLPNLGVGGSLETNVGLSALDVSSPAFLSVPAAFLYAQPSVVVGLAVLGFGVALVRGRAFLLLPLSLVLLIQVYFAAAHGRNPIFYEVFRYLTGVVPVIAFLALHGWRRIERWCAAEGRGRRWRTTALAILVLSFLAPPPVGARDWFRGRPAVTSGPLAFLFRDNRLLAQDRQVAFRFLVDALDRDPTCLVVTKVARVSSAGPDPEASYLLVGGTLREARVVPAGPAGLEAAIAEAGEGASCVLFYRGLDCNLAHGLDCEAEARGRSLLREERLDPADRYDYSDDDEYGPMQPTVRFALHVVKGRPSGLAPEAP